MFGGNLFGNIGGKEEIDKPKCGQFKLMVGCERKQLPTYGEVVVFSHDH